jgi:sugar/nucleoside kinase (ribokinase family)
VDLQAPGYVVIGHVTKDLLADGGAIAGGTALYSALTAERLGASAAMVTSLAPADLDLLRLPRAEGVRCATKAASATTTFANHYQGQHRWQEVHAVADRLTFADVPPAWRSTPILHLGPVAQEIDPTLPWSELFPDALIGVTPQGWLRNWENAGRVIPVDWTAAAQLLPATHVLVMSAEDVGNNTELLLRYVRLAPLAVVTAGADPATIYDHGREVATVPARPATPIDFTGAGDVFTTGFLVRYRETGDPIAAADFAHAVAASAIEAEGATGIPTRGEVEERMRNT